MSGTRPPVRYIRREEKGVRASDLGPSENQAKNSFVAETFFALKKLLHLRTYHVNVTDSKLSLCN